MGMKFPFIIVIAVTVPITVFSQTTYRVQDSISKEAIPYVNVIVLNENAGTTANEKGEFILSDTFYGKVIVLSAVGYTSKRIIYSNLIKVINLQPVVTELKELVVLANKKSKKQQLGAFRKSDIRSSFANNEYPWSLAKYFPFPDSLRDTPFIETIGIFTESKVNNAKFILKILSCDSAGMPGTLLYTENIIATVKKGNHTTHVNVGDLMITMPDNGLYIVFECLMIEENKSEFTFTKKRTREVFTKTRYNPSIGGTLVDSVPNSWYYTNRSQWQNFSVVYNASGTVFPNKFDNLAISITLTD